jgi:hypothetical protein
MQDVKEIKFRRYYKVGYEIRRELVDGSFYSEDSPDLEMKRAYTPSGDYLGDWKMARVLFHKAGIRLAEKTSPDHCVCSIGFNPEKQKWYGWSHRACVGFGIGDKIFEEEYGDDHTLFTQHGSETITTLAEAKVAASRFAESVS